MTRDTLLASAERLVARLAHHIEGLDVSSNERERLSAACFHQALEHHEAVLCLVRNNLVGSAFALVRPLFETYVRGLWLRNCATDAEVVKFQKGKINKTFSELISAIESCPGYNAGVLSDIKRRSWDMMNEFTHGGFLQTVRRLTEDSITSNYPEVEVCEAITFSGAIGLLATTEVCLLAKREDLAVALLADMERYAANSEAF